MMIKRRCPCNPPTDEQISIEIYTWGGGGIRKRKRIDSQQPTSGCTFNWQRKEFFYYKE